MSSLYTQLEFSNPAKQIRLLRLEPSPAETDECAFSMEVCDFQENTRPSYIAISYTWGAPVPLLPVVINGFRLRVRFNCWYALWQMRYHGHTSNASFWIDSLCINQGDDEEKGHQVATMGEIFSSAASVAASLGTGETLGNVQEVLASRDKSEIDKLRDRFDQLPYFDRVWIKQEIVLAKDISIFYGLGRLSWGQFDQAVNPTNIWDFQDGNSDLSSGPFRRRRLEKHSVITQLCNHHRSQVTKTSTLVDLMVKYETAKGSVAADKIYALLSLLPQTDPIRRNLPITYGEATWPSLFQTLVRLLYSYYQDQDVGDKHSVLWMISRSLGICGLGEDVGASLESQVCHPLDARSFHQESAAVKICCLHVLNDENSGELTHEMLRVGMNQTEPPDAVRILRLGGYTCNSNHPGSPTNPFSYGIRPEVHIPPQPKSLRTLHNFMERKWFLARSQKLLVNSDVRPGDLLGTLVWDANRHDTMTNPLGVLAYAILRRTTFADESESQDHDVPLEEEAQCRRSALFLHSWAIPVTGNCTMFSRLHRTQPHLPGTKTLEPNDIGRLRLHYRDALVPLLLKYHPLQSLLYSKSVLNSGAINVSSRVENPEDTVETEYGEDGCMCRVPGFLTNYDYVWPRHE